MEYGLEYVPPKLSGWIKLTVNGETLRTNPKGVGGFDKKQLFEAFKGSTRIYPSWTKAAMIKEIVKEHPEVGPDANAGRPASHQHRPPPVIAPPPVVHIPIEPADVCERPLDTPKEVRKALIIGNATPATENPPSLAAASPTAISGAHVFAPVVEERKTKKLWDSVTWSGQLFTARPNVSLEHKDDPVTKREKAESPMWFGVKKETAFLYARPSTRDKVQVWETEGVRLVIMNNENIRNLIRAAERADPAMGLVVDTVELERRIAAVLANGPEVVAALPTGPRRINRLLNGFKHVIEQLSRQARVKLFTSERWRKAFPTLSPLSSFAAATLIINYPYTWFSMAHLIVWAFAKTGNRTSFKEIDAAIAMWLCSLEFDGFIAAEMATRDNTFHEEVVICGKSRHKLTHVRDLAPPVKKWEHRP